MHERLQGQEPPDRLFGTGAQQNFFRTAAGKGWALVGDAAHHKDSITARGITDAFRQAELLADAISGVIDHRDELNAALSRYRDEHSSLLVDGYEATMYTSTLRITADRLAMLRAVSTSPEFIERYFAAVAGACSVQEFYSDDLVQVLAAGHRM